jgi:hypothetical protein
VDAGKGKHTMEKKIQRHPFRARAARRRGRQAGSPRPIEVLTPAQRKHLEVLDALCGRLGRTPLREELPPYLRMELAVSFGSLRGAFLCLGRVPPSQQEVRELRRGLVPK